MSLKGRRAVMKMRDICSCYLTEVLGVSVLKQPGVRPEAPVAMEVSYRSSQEPRRPPGVGH